jgi:hypothetical protein
VTHEILQRGPAEARGGTVIAEDPAAPTTDLASIPTMTSQPLGLQLVAGMLSFCPPPVRPGSAVQPPAAPASLGRGAADAVAHRGQHPPRTVGDAALRAGNSSGLTSNRSPGRHVGRSRPRGSSFHGLDGVVDTRARHDAPSPGQFCTATAPSQGHRGLRHPYATGRHRRQRGENLPPGSTEQPAPALIPRAPAGMCQPRVQSSGRGGPALHVRRACHAGQRAQRRG